MIDKSETIVYMIDKSETIAQQQL